RRPTRPRTAAAVRHGEEADAAGENEGQRGIAGPDSSSTCAAKAGSGPPGDQVREASSFLRPVAAGEGRGLTHLAVAPSLPGRLPGQAGRKYGPAGIGNGCRGPCADQDLADYYRPQLPPPWESVTGLASSRVRDGYSILSNRVRRIRLRPSRAQLV